MTVFPLPAGQVFNDPVAPTTFSFTALQQKIAALQAKQDWHKELLGELDAEQKQVSVTDPDTRKMPVAQGLVVGYNAQIAVDARHKLIAADEVTSEETDLRQLADVALAAKANLEIERADVVADTGYYNASEVSRCVDHGLTPYIPKADTSADTARGLYGKSRFQYDAGKDVYVCPAGAELTYPFSTDELGRELRYYRASGCKDCALKKQCTRNKANRTISRAANRHLMEAMAQRMQAQPEKFKLRKQLAEHPFGTLKRWFGYTHFLLKGLVGHVVAEVFAFELFELGVFRGREAERGLGNLGGEDGVFALFPHAALLPFAGQFVADGDGTHPFLDPIVGIALGLVKRAGALGGEFRVFNLLHAFVAYFGQPAFERLGLGAGNGLDEAENAFGVGAIQFLRTAGG